jgi:hypothetical protein
MLKKILLGIVLVVVVLLIIVALQPGEYSVSRKATIDAPPPVVFSQVNDFHKWEAWSPWTKRDPNAKITFEGPASGEGAKFAWDGDKEVGQGQMSITKSDRPDLILIDLEFIKPFPGISLTEFKFQPAADNPAQTEVTWNMSGHKNFVSKAVCMFMNMDQMIGGDFEKGLASMKAVAEAEAKSSVDSQPPAEPPAETDASATN